MDQLEPPTTGKAIMKTSHGDFEIELWCKEAPKACRNFIQLALEGYYNNTEFFRIISKLAIQGGDRSNTGQFGTSIFDDKPFENELHPRLKLNRRGLIATVT